MPVKEIPFPEDPDDKLFNYLDVLLTALGDALLKWDKLSASEQQEWPLAR